MEIQKNKGPSYYNARLNQILSFPTPQTLSNFLQSSQSEMPELISSSANSFIGNFQGNIIKAKLQILKLINCYIKDLNTQEIQLIMAKLRFLTQQVQTILKQGILNLYSQLSQTIPQNPDNPHLPQILPQLKNILQNLLRDHFIFKKISKMDTKITFNSLKLILSQTKLDRQQQPLTTTNINSNIATSIKSEQSIRQFMSEKTIMEISKRVHCKSIQELIQEQLIYEQNQIYQGEETCRVCRQVMKLKDLDMHVKYCSKLQKYYIDKDQIVTKQTALIQHIKSQILGDGILQLKEKEPNSELNRLYKKIINLLQVSPQMQRRISHIDKKKHREQKNIILQIQKFIELNGSNEHLVKFLQLKQQRQLIQKKITCTQNIYFHKKQQNPQKSQLNLIKKKAPQKSMKQNLKTKKSLFSRRDQSQNISDSTSNVEESVKFKSIKFYMPQYSDSGESGNCGDKVDGNSNEDGGSREQGRTQRRNSGRGREKQLGSRSMTQIFVGRGDCASQIGFQGIFLDNVDFQVIKYIAKGAFGKVYLVRRKMTNDIYALKVIKIQQSWGQKQLDAIKNQHQILSQVAGEHLVKAPFSFTQGSAHFFVLQYMPGGDLSKMIQQQVYLDINQAQFYLAQIVLAIDHLHKMGIIHRDLKPQNLIFDQNGHIKLTDFGLSQIRITDKLRRARKINFISLHQNPQKKPSQTQCQLSHQKKSKIKSIFAENKKNKIKIIGTPDYIAPQIISGESLDNLSIDWWSLGVIAYEMMIGVRPFCANTPEQVFENILENRIQWPEIGEGEDMITPCAADFIKGLLNQDYMERLGAKSVQQIKQHPFFTGIKWQAIKTQQPPLMPAIDKKQNYKQSQQVPQLKSQIMNAIESNNKAKSTFKLDNFVRYDILVEETLSSAGKKRQRHQERIRRLRNIAMNFGDRGADGLGQQDQQTEQQVEEEEGEMDIMGYSCGEISDEKQDGRLGLDYIQGSRQDEYRGNE